MRLSYASPCGSEQARKLTGSYYTPIDVSRFFWNEFFRLRGISNATAALSFLKAHTFIEPSVGAGALFFALIEKLLKMGLDIRDVSAMRAHLVDLNVDALQFVREQITKLEGEGGVLFGNINYVHSDFMQCNFDISDSPTMVFGNPPFVANKRGSSKWKNSYADFLERSISLSGDLGSINFIVPLSISFSRDYSDLRSLAVSERRTVALANFDNIPDTLFKSGKPKHSNTNKANSQRCTIFTSIPSETRAVLSSRLHRWSKKSRNELLSSPADYTDVTSYQLDDQIPRPQNRSVLDYLQRSCRSGITISNYVVRDGRFGLHVAGVARNYIGLREQPSPSVNSLWFDNQEEFLRILGVVTSDLFFDYWLTIGDGFHITRSNILNFPLHEELIAELDLNLESTLKMWRGRRRFVKSKLNSGIETLSYDFSTKSESLYPVVERILS